MPITAAKIALLSMTLVGAVSLDGNRAAANGERPRTDDPPKADDSSPAETRR